ncbi:MAG: MFS transporter [Micrococcales bacterium]|nr:MFS transporter [Micrococcales bacterium]
MLRPYRDVLTRPGAVSFSTAALLARMPMAMAGIGTVLMVQAVYGSYALAGQVAAVYLVVSAVAAPALAALVDRHGQARVMRPALVVSGVGMAGLVAVGVAQPAVGWAFLAAGVAGLGKGSFGALVRARWSVTLDGEPGPLHVAYSWESVLDEVVFVVGPVLATLAATAVHPSAGLVVAAVAMLGGGWWFLAQRRTEPLPSGRRARSRTVLRSPGLVVLLVVFSAMGVIFGAADVATVAFATEKGQRPLTGLVLAAFGVGSLVAGLLYGVRRWVSPPARRFAVSGVALAVGASSFVLVGSLGQLAIVMVVAGGAIAPTMITGTTLVTRIVPPDRLTEGLTWVGTSLVVGVSGGAALAGSAIDQAGSHGGFLVVVAAGAVVGVLVLATMPTLTRASGLAERIAPRVGG